MALEVGELRNGHCRAGCTKNPTNNCMLTRKWSLEHKICAILVVQDADEVRHWLVACGWPCCPMMSAGLHLQLSLQEWTGREMIGTSDSN